MAIRNIRRQATVPGVATSTAAPIYVDSDDNKLKMIPAGTGTTEVTLLDDSSTQTKAQTITDAAVAASTHQDLLGSDVTLTPSSTITAANGLNAIRGQVDITAGKTVGDGSASYLTAVYGRVNFNTATINIASGDLAAVYGKFDMGSTSTLTSGHIAPVQANIVNPPSGAAAAGVSLFYGESASGTKIGNGLELYMAADFAFKLTDVNTSNFLPAISSTTLNGLNIKVQLNGTTYYIPTKQAA